MRSIVFVAGLLASVWGGAAAAAGSPDAAAPTGRLVLEDFFRGRFTAQGTFVNTRDGTQRGLKVAMNGTWDGRTVTLVEDFVYSDGERDRKTWRFTKVADGRYRATREDVIGEGVAVQDGDAVRLSYTARVKASGSSYDLSFRDTLMKIGSRTVLNTADVRFLFFPVGRVELTIHKVGR
jgi:hypothetical protein